MLRWFEHSLKRPQQRRRGGGGGIVQPSAELWLFEVQAATAADGVYQCYKQTSFGIYSAPAIEVLNVVENETVGTYQNALAPGDKLACWQMVDEAGTPRWAGIPITPSVRRVRTTESVADQDNIACNIIASDGETEITTGLGSGLDVYCSITRDIVPAEYGLSEAAPRLADNTDLLAVNLSGIWWCVTVFQCAENCPCVSA